MFGNGTVAVMVCSNVGIMQSVAGITEGEEMKNYIVTVEIDDIITNRLVKAESAEEAERKVKEEKNEV